MSHVEVENNGGVIVEVFVTRPAKSFNIVSVAGQDDVVADNPNETLTFVAGSNMTITTDESTDTITFSAVSNGTIDGGTVT